MYICVCIYIHIYLRFHLFLERGEGREKEREMNINVWEKHWSVASLLCPNQGRNPQPRHVSRPGTEPAIFPFAAQHPTHCATSVGAILSILKLPSYSPFLPCEEGAKICSDEETEALKNVVMAWGYRATKYWESKFTLACPSIRVCRAEHTEKKPLPITDATEKI